MNSQRQTMENLSAKLFKQAKASFKSVFNSNHAFPYAVLRETSRVGGVRSQLLRSIHIRAWVGGMAGIDGSVVLVEGVRAGQPT